MLSKFVVTPLAISTFQTSVSVLHGIFEVTKVRRDATAIRIFQIQICTAFGVP